MNAIWSVLQAAAPELVKAAAPSIVKALIALFDGDEERAAKHARIAAQKVAAKLAIRRRR